jgi:hypothetical protein
MAYLFKVEGQAVLPNTETLLISPFKEIWERDEHPEKDRAIAEFKYMEFMTSALKSNPYKGYDTAQRRVKVKESCGFESNWEPDDLIKDGMALIEEFQIEASENYQYYLAALKAANSMKDFFSTPGILQMANAKTGNPLYKPKDLTNALKDTDAVLTNLKGLKTKIEEELYTAKKSRANKVISSFARRESFKK